MKTTTTTNNKTTNYTKRATTNIKSEEMPADCVPFEVFAKALKKAVKEHYERIA